MTSTGLKTRLQRLDGFLEQDPNNQSLLLDAFETARQLRDWPHAARYAALAMSQWPDPLWKLRAGEVALAQLNWDEAEKWLEAVRHDLLVGDELRCAAEHQLAEVMLHTGKPGAGIELISDRFEGDGAASSAPAAQVLWLRLLHRVGRLQDVVDYAQRWETAGLLSSLAAGVASLAALDLDRSDLADRLAEASLQAGHRSFEALIARASVCLGRADAAAASTLLSEALQLNAHDGRSWAMFAFAGLLEQQFDQAIVRFETALAYMPDHVGTWHGLGWALIQQSNLARAKEVFEHALEMDRNFAESHGGLAVVLALAGDVTGATSAMETARRLDRTSVAARYAQAVLTGDHKDTQRLRQLAARALTGRGVVGEQAAQRMLQ